MATIQGYTKLAENNYEALMNAVAQVLHCTAHVEYSHTVRYHITFANFYCAAVLRYSSTRAQAGPVAIVVDASEWHSYAGGIFDGCNQEHPDLNHGVVLVGYGEENGE